MAPALTRRSCAAAAIGAALCGALPARAQAPSAAQPPGPDHSSVHARAALAALEARNGGRLGVVALDTGSGRRIDYRAEERFAMCSTHKLFSAAAVLTMVDQGHMKLDRRVPFGRADLLEYAPITRKNVDAGFMTVDALCEAAIEWSDNTAGNLLLVSLGGPPGLTAYARSLGDQITRLDRIETDLNEATPGDPRDTTTPAAMLENLRRIVLGDVLSRRSRERMTAWLIANKTGDKRLRAGLPGDWRVGDKTGGGGNGATNDIAVIWPPSRGPIIVAAYFAESPASPDDRNAVLAQVGRLIAENA